MFPGRERRDAVGRAERELNAIGESETDQTQRSGGNILQLDEFEVVCVIRVAPGSRRRWIVHQFGDDKRRGLNDKRARTRSGPRTGNGRVVGTGQVEMSEV